MCCEDVIDTLANPAIVASACFSGHEVNVCKYITDTIDFDDLSAKVTPMLSSNLQREKCKQLIASRSKNYRLNNTVDLLRVLNNVRDPDPETCISLYDLSLDTPMNLKAISSHSSSCSSFIEQFNRTAEQTLVDRSDRLKWISVSFVFNKLQMNIVVRIYASIKRERCVWNFTRISASITRTMNYLASIVF